MKLSKITGLIGALTLILAIGLRADEPAAGSGYKILKQYHLGGNAQWDYLTLDSVGRRLYIARASHVSVFDADSGAVLGDIPNTAGVHGVALALEHHHGFTSNGTDGTVHMFDLKTLKVLDTIKVGKKPDAIIFDSASDRIFVFNGKSEDTTAIDAATGKVAGTVALGGGPEFAVSDGKGKMWVNLEDNGEVVQFDSKKLQVLARYPLAPAKTPTGLSMDPEHRRLFVGCRSKVMVIMDADTGKILASPPIGGGVDATAFDKETGLAFASNGDGTLTVIGEKSPGQFAVLDTIKTAKGSKTMAFDPKTHSIFLGAMLPAGDGKPAGFGVMVVGK